MSDPAALPDPASVAGIPLHTRSLQIDVARDGEALRARGEILDLRKQGFVPTGGDLQTAGFIHHMTLTLQVAAETGEIRSIEATQPHLAFRPCAATNGETCSDPLPRLQALRGARVNAGFAKRLAQVFGGALGCSHLLTLGQLLGSALLPVRTDEWAHWGQREDGEPCWKSTLVLDGAARPDGEMGVFVQANGFALRPRRELTTPLERLASQHEVRIAARIGLDTMTLGALDAAERRRTLDDFDPPWRSRSAELADRVGGPAVGGLAGVFLSRFGTDEADRPLLDALLNLSPGAIQCFAALSDRIFAAIAQRNAPDAAPAKPAPVLSVGGLPNSCYMWRDDGALAATRFGERPTADDDAPSRG